MKINVTWSDIAQGTQAKTTACMVSLALQRELGVSYASVGPREATVRIDGQEVKVYLPKEVGDKIKSWDSSHFVLPFQFEFVCSGFLTGTMIAPPHRSATRASHQPSFA